MSADFVIINIGRPQFAGAWDVVAAVILCQTDSVDFSFVNGRKVVDAGRLLTADLPLRVERTQAAARMMAQG
jgi:8-oxoguanine deaminase